MQEGKYYKHEKGRDAVIFVRNSVETSQGWLVSVSWHCLNFGRRVMGSEGQQDYFISMEDAMDWHLYEVERD